MVSLVGLTLFPAAGAPIWRRLFDAEDLDFDAVRLHTLALLDRGLELDPEHNQKTPHAAFLVALIALCTLALAACKDSAPQALGTLE